MADIQIGEVLDAKCPTGPASVDLLPKSFLKHIFLASILSHDEELEWKEEVTKRTRHVDLDTSQDNKRTLISTKIGTNTLGQEV